MCAANSFFTRLRIVSLLQGRKDVRWEYTLERSWPPCSRHCSSILEQARKLAELQLFFNPIKKPYTDPEGEKKMFYLSWYDLLKQDRVDLWSEEL